MLSSIARQALCLKGNIALPQQKDAIRRNVFNKYQWKFSDISVNLHFSSSIKHNSCRTYLVCASKSNQINTETILKQIVPSNKLKPFDRGFKTSSPHYLHPVLFALLKPLSRIVPMIVGRKLRKWWRNLSESEKLKFSEKFKVAKTKHAYVLGGKNGLQLYISDILFYIANSLFTLLYIIIKVFLHN